MSVKKIYIRALLLGVLLVALLIALAIIGLGSIRPNVRATQEEKTLLTQIFGGKYVPELPADREDFDVERHSWYVPMRDGVRIAVDVLLPADMQEGERLPAVFIPTRYWRSWDLRFGLDKGLGADLYQHMLVAHGYAVVLVDARGSGASFGTRAYPWSKEERQDYVELMDWAISQPWCDGNLAASGISYAGTAAEFMGISAHPALKAVLPQFSLYDTYTDIAFPGGVFNNWFVENWGEFNQQLDSGMTPGGLGVIGELLVRGPRPIPKPDNTAASNSLTWEDAALSQALAEHAANVDIAAAARQARYRDDVSPLAGTDVDGFSPHSGKEAAEAGNAAWYSWGGWHDGAYAASLLKRFTNLNVPQRAVIGAWNHAGVQDTSPFHAADAPPSPPRKVQFLEQIRFLDYYLKGQGERPASVLHYYTMGEGAWKTTQSWPPEGFSPLRLHLDAGHKLTAEPGNKTSADDADILQVRYDTGSGGKNRWRTQIFRSDVIMQPQPIDSEGVLYWQSEPLDQDVETTGHGIASFELLSDAPDAALFAYLEDVAPDGTVRYVTEAPFRLANRKEMAANGTIPCLGEPCHSYLRADEQPLPENSSVTVQFKLLPVSWLFQKGHRIRFSITGADADQFERTPKEGPAPTLRILRPAAASYLELPVKQ